MASDSQPCRPGPGSSSPGDGSIRYRALLDALDEGYLLGEVRFDARGCAVDVHYLESNPAAVRTGFVRMRRADPRIAAVDEASDGQAALEAIAGLPPNVVLMDLNMPRVNGLQATHEIRLRWPQVQVIARSVQDDAAARRSLLEAGATAVISKSADGQQVVDTVLRVSRRGGPD